MWYFLYKVLEAGQEFEKKKQKIGNVHPKKIIISQDGVVSIVSQFSIPGETNSNFEEKLEKKDAYLGNKFIIQLLKNCVGSKRENIQATLILVKHKCLVQG